ncbi:MAG: cytochrome oxidase [Myxococcota bacterium]
MNAIHLTLFVSLVLVVLGVVLFLHSITQRDHDYAERLALLPLEDDERAFSDDFAHSTSTREEGTDCDDE